MVSALLQTNGGVAKPSQKAPLLALMPPSLRINHAYPNLAIFLRMMESMEHDHLYRVLSPFFPPRSRNVVEKQLTDLGSLDDCVQKLTYVYTLPKPPEPVIRQRFFSRKKE